MDINPAEFYVALHIDMNGFIIYLTTFICVVVVSSKCMFTITLTNQTRQKKKHNCKWYYDKTNEGSLELVI